MADSGSAVPATVKPGNAGGSGQTLNAPAAATPKFAIAGHLKASDASTALTEAPGRRGIGSG